MNILIKGMDMPKCCFDCSCLNDEYCQCQAIGKTIEVDWIEHRPDWCPLIEVSEWILVTEQLPELNQEVLVYAVGKIDGFIYSGVFALTERFLFKFFSSSKGPEEWRLPWQYFMEDYEITHWMPLPEPPKEE